MVVAQSQLILSEFRFWINLSDFLPILNQIYYINRHLIKIRLIIQNRLTYSMITFPKRAITKENPYKINFVCLGNICRSPTAEGVFQHLVDEAGLSSYFEIDSSGTGAWHVGQPANSKSQAIAQQRGVVLHSRARKIVPSDLEYFDLTVAMDFSNHSDIISMSHKAEHHDSVVMLRDFDPDPDDGEVPDPYYGGIDGFNQVYDIVERSCRELLEVLRTQIKI